jgi:hypothetical protein
MEDASTAATVTNVLQRTENSPYLCHIVALYEMAIPTTTLNTGNADAAIPTIQLESPDTPQGSSWYKARTNQTTMYW